VIIGFLIDGKHVVLEHKKTDNPENAEQQGSVLVHEYLPMIDFGGKDKFTFRQFAEVLLFHPLRPDNDDDDLMRFLTKLDELLTPITKAVVYKDFQSSFDLKHYGGNPSPKNTRKKKKAEDNEKLDEEVSGETVRRSKRLKDTEAGESEPSSNDEIIVKTKKRRTYIEDSDDKEEDVQSEDLQSLQAENNGDGDGDDDGVDDGGGDRSNDGNADGDAHGDTDGDGGADGDADGSDDGGDNACIVFDNKGKNVASAKQSDTGSDSGGDDVDDDDSWNGDFTLDELRNLFCEGGVDSEEDSDFGMHAKKLSTDRHLPRKRKAIELKQAVTRKQAKVSVKKASQEADVSKIHPYLPPEHIQVSSTPWYWTTPIRELSVSDLTDRIAENLAKVMYNSMALTYVTHKNRVSGDETLVSGGENQVSGGENQLSGGENQLSGGENQVSGCDLFAILSSPSCDEDLDDSWVKTLDSLEQYCARYALSGIELQIQNLMPAKGQSFLEYVQSILDQLPQADTTSTVKKRFLMHYWQRRDVSSVKNFTVQKVLSTIHTLKCCIMFDNLCRCYFVHQGSSDLKTVAFGLAETKIFPRTGSSVRKEWEQCFNIMVHGCSAIVVYPLIGDAWITKHGKNPFACLLGQTRELMKGRFFSEAVTHQLSSGLKPTNAATNHDAAEDLSRPAFLELNVNNKDLLQVLQGLYFDTNGCLRRDLLHAISYEPVHGFIRFGVYYLDDVRYFIPLKRVPAEREGKVSTDLCCCMYSGVF